MTLRGAVRFAVVAGLGLAAVAAEAQVESASPGAFRLVRTVRIDAAPAEVWAAIVRVENWWHPDHTYLGDSSRMRLDPFPGGCFCESLPGGGAEHMRVLYAAPGELLRLGGGLGPLQEFAVSGAMTWALTIDGTGTSLTVTYAVAGEVTGGLDNWAGPVDGVLREAVQRLARYVTTGSPESS